MTEPTLPKLGVLAILDQVDLPRSQKSLTPPEEHRLPIPTALFDEVYALPTAPQCRVPGLEKDCVRTCEPEIGRAHV